jgi:deleted-in-malignant-brain-tumors protein 1
MYYTSGASTASYQNLAFVPMFEPVFQSSAMQQAAQTVCGGNTQCLLDYSATGNELLARSTQITGKSFVNINQLLG